MALALPNSTDFRAGLRRVLRPKSKLGKTTLWFGYLTLALQILRLIFRPGPATFLSGWASFITFLFVGFTLLMGLRWLRQRLLWRLRNRLIVTYVFIGVVPLILLGAMAYLAGYLFAGQFATYVAGSHLQSELQHLDGTNRSMAKQFGALAHQNRLNPQVAGEIASASSENFHHRTVSVWDGETGFALSENGHVAAQPPVKPSPAISGDFAGFVLDNNRLQLRAVKHIDEGTHHLVVISNMPITPEVLRPVSSQLGEVGVVPPDELLEKGTGGKSQGEPLVRAGDKAGQAQAGAPSGEKVTTDTSSSSITHEISRQYTRSVQAGQLPSPVNWFDMHVAFGTRFDYVDWISGKRITGLVLVDTRPSMIYATLFSALGEKAGAVRDILIVVGILLLSIEVIALIIGVRLTRSMTKSVAELYTATEHVNRGELTHQIRVRSSDQMAALEQSFNSMTRSLARLIAEQKEKQRMESELAIAHEVQTLLFPADLSGLRGLEVHGVCRPARTVSGDYYDFIPLSDSRLILAVGDISGKGISAALLMATVHAFVRAYSLEPERTLATVALGAGMPERNVLTVVGRENGNGGELSPAFLMSTLNYQLYRSTPPEKYATMFLGAYDSDSRSLTYSNAGHLPPLLLGRDGGIRRLETSGTVVGLFDRMAYEESVAAMRTGDIFVAYSDGITEPENEFGEFGEERLIELISQHRNEPLSRISEVVTTAVSDWIAGGEQPDDVTLVLARAR